MHGKSFLKFLGTFSRLVSWKLVARWAGSLGHAMWPGFPDHEQCALLAKVLPLTTAEQRGLFFAETIEPHHLGAAWRLVGRVGNRRDRIGRNRQGFAADFARGLGLFAVTAGCVLGT